MLSHEMGSEGHYGRHESGWGEQVYLEELDSNPGYWIFDRAIPAGDTVIACFHHVEHPGEEIRFPLRREEAVKFAKAILE